MPAINYGTRGRLGVLLPSGNQVAEPQFRAMLPHDVSMHTTRLKLTGSSERELLVMADVEAASRLVCDAGASLVVFHSTVVSTFSTSLEASILDRIGRTCGMPVTATSEAIVARHARSVLPHRHALSVRRRKLALALTVAGGAAANTAVQAAEIESISEGRLYARFFDKLPKSTVLETIL